MAVPVPKVHFTKLFINNEWRNAASGKTFPVINPATGEKIVDVPEGDKEDINEAVGAARKAFELGSPWRTMDASQRGRLLHKLSELIEKNEDYLARLESLDNGKILSDARAEVKMAISCLQYYSGFADKIHGMTIPADGEVFSYTRIEPVGVCGAILPWNAPMIMCIWKIAPALAAGCTIVIKPAEQTPLSALYVASLVKEAGFPPGVVNIVTGFGGGAGAALSSHMNVDKIGFTGSTVVGKMIQAAASSNVKHVTLELGGKSPLVIFDDCDVDLAAKVAHQALYYNQGQVCVAPTRAFVQESVYDKFVAKSRELAMARVVGPPLDPKSQTGPLVNEAQFKKVMELIESGMSEGAKLETGGKRHGSKGYFIQPTVFSNVTDSMRIAREEIFGPVQQIMKFKTLEEVIKRANNTEYGLAAGVFTRDINKAITYAHSVNAGTVWINTYQHIAPQCPFGGYKMSGIGREMGLEGIREFCEIKTVTIKIPEKNS